MVSCSSWRGSLGMYLHDTDFGCVFTHLVIIMISDNNLILKAQVLIHKLLASS